MSLVDSWARDARLGSVRQATQRVGTSAEPVILDRLLEHAQEKCDFMEQQNNSHGGDGLQQALAEATAARADAAQARVRQLQLLQQRLKLVPRPSLRRRI